MKLEKIAEKILEELIENYFSGKRYILHANIGYYFDNNGNLIKINIDDIIKFISNELMDGYDLLVIPFERMLSLENNYIQEMDCSFLDVELKIVKN